MAETWTHYANEGQIRDEADRLVAAEVWGDDARLIEAAPKMAELLTWTVRILRDKDKYNSLAMSFVESEILAEGEALLASIQGEQG